MLLDVIAIYADCLYNTTRVHSCFFDRSDFSKRIDGYIFVSWILMCAPLICFRIPPARDVLCLCATIPFLTSLLNQADCLHALNVINMLTSAPHFFHIALLYLL